MISVTSSGSFAKTEAFLNKMMHGELFTNLNQWGQMGVMALASATPVRTGLAANSWTYQVGYHRGRASIGWFNTDVESGANVAVLIQYGHGTGTGGYVQGRDFINPAMRPVFDQIADYVWERVKNA